MGNKEKGGGGVRAGAAKSLCPEHSHIRPSADWDEGGWKRMEDRRESLSDGAAVLYRLTRSIFIAALTVFHTTCLRAAG